jgi:hypothetical protein
VSVKILHVVAHQQGQNQLCGNVTNAFVQAYTNKKVYAVAGLEFGLELVGKIVIIRKGLYGLVSSSERWHYHSTDTLRGLNFVPTRSDAMSGSDSTKTRKRTSTSVLTSMMS